MKYKLTVRSIWEYGQRVDAQGNPHQEDSLFPAHGEARDSDRLFILCDGMGGHEAGEVASATVCRAMSESVARQAADATGEFTDAMLLQAVADAYSALNALPEAASHSEKKMGTTMTFLKLHAKGATIAHIGDSRVYHIRPGKGRDDTQILFHTEDHSLVNELIRMKELTPEEAKASPQKNVITRAMQPNMDRPSKPDIYHTVDIQPGDYFYLCSDGMLEQMEDDNLCFNFSDAMGDIDRKVDILTQATQENRDNHTAIIVQVTEVEDPITAEEARAAGVAARPKPITAIVDDSDSTPPPTMAPSVAPAAKPAAKPATAQHRATRQAAPVQKEGSAASMRNKGIVIGVAVAIVVLVFLLLFVRTQSTPEPAPIDDPSMEVTPVPGQPEQRDAPSTTPASRLENKLQQSAGRTGRTETGNQPTEEQTPQPEEPDAAAVSQPQPAQQQGTQPVAGDKDNESHVGGPSHKPSTPDRDNGGGAGGKQDSQTTDDGGSDTDGGNEPPAEDNDNPQPSEDLHAV